MLLGHAIRNIDLKLMPILILDITHALHLLRVIRVVIDRRHRSQLIETLDQHTLMIHVGETHRADQLFQPFRPGPLLNRTKQGIRHLIVVDKIHEAKACPLLLPDLIARTIDDAGDASRHFSIFIG